MRTNLPPANLSRSSAFLAACASLFGLSTRASTRPTILPADVVTGPVLTFGIGTADDVLDAPRGLPRPIVEFLDQLEVLGRFPSVGFGPSTMIHALPTGIRQPVEPGNDVLAARTDATGERGSTSAAIAAAHRLVAKVSPRPARLVQVVGGADFGAGTTFLRTFAEHAPLFAQGETPLALTFFTQARQGPMPWAEKAEDVQAPAEEAAEATGAAAARAPRELRFMPGRQAAKAKLVSVVEEPLQIGPEDVLTRLPAHRSDWVFQGLQQVPQAMVDIVRVEHGSEATVDPLVRRIQSVRAYVAARGTAGGSGVEVRRLERELGPLPIGSFVSQVFEAPSAYGVSGVGRQLRRSLQTLGGWYHVPGDKAGDGSSRKAVLFGLGHPEALARLPQQVGDGLGLDAGALVHCCAPAPIEGAIFAIWIEAAVDEIEANYPDFFAHPFAPALQQTMERERRLLAQRDGNMGVSV